ncbi:MAG TPA: hypothetical protein DDW90_10235 [Cyanobacteria bacterium UBA9971]|nr:hypothetical protein [Cyanobacteria bacterium UBA9971]
MKRKAAKFLLGVFSVFLLLNLCFCTSVSAKSQFVIKQIIPDMAGKLILVTGTGNQNVEFKTIKLSNPDRLVVDINNAMLLGSKKVININNEDIKNLKIAQFSSDPDVVRLVITANTEDILKKIKIRKNQNTILLDLNELKPTNIAETPLYKDREVPEASDENITAQTEILVNLDINNAAKTPADQEKEALLKSLQDKIDHNIVLKNIKHFGNRVIISGTGILSITEPMILENPRRLAFDIPESALKSPESIQPIVLRNGDFLRIGQFDNKTVRIVVETQRPEIYKTIISPDMQSLLIAPENEVSFLEFPDSESIGEIRDIKIINQDKKITKIVIISAKPIIHNLKHNNSPDGLCLDFYNLKQPKKEIIYNLQRTGQFHGINFENIERYPNGSRWLFPLNKTTKIESKLSLDARVLEITLKDVMPVSTWRSNYKQGVVLDAGHGGQEPGAIRAGNYEKNITIDITQRVKTYLKQSGINVIMTREEDETVSLKQRAAITNTEDPDAFVSIHVNSSENSGVRGLETYYFTPQSKALAQSVHAKLVNYINSTDRGIRTARFYVIRNTAVPAILAEVGYLSNDSERYSILTEERKNATAKAIAEGILNYLRSKK